MCELCIAFEVAVEAVRPWRINCEVSEMKKLSLCVTLLLLTAGVSSAALEAIITRVEENGRLLVPVRGVFELTGATVDWNAYDQSVDISSGGTFISMWVNNRMASVNGSQVYLDVPPRNVRGRVHIPLRFVGETLGRAVDYTGGAVYLTAPGAQDIILYVEDAVQPRSRPASGELLPQSNDRRLSTGDLAGLSNWQLTLARNEIYARHGRSFNNAHIRAYFQSTGWYSPRSNFRESWLSQTEQSNAAFIRDYQARVFGSAATRP
ncbi:MAG: stalk domain-containing protein [Armatimonadota bacterium]